MKRSKRRLLRHAVETGGYIADCDPIKPHSEALADLKRRGFLRNEGGDYFPTPAGAAEFNWRQKRKHGRH